MLLSYVNQEKFYECSKNYLYNIFKIIDSKNDLLLDQLILPHNLNRVNKYFDEISDIEDFLIDSKIPHIEKQLKNAPDGYKELVVQTAGRLLRENRLDSIAKLRTIDELLDTKLSLLIGG